MEVRTSNYDMQKALALLSAADNKGSKCLPILEYVQIKTTDDSVTMEYTDLENGIIAEIKAKVLQPGVAVIPLKSIAPVAATGKKESDFKIKNIGTPEDPWKFNISAAGGMEMDVEGRDPDEFPTLPEPDANEYYGVCTSRDILYGLKYVLPTVASRYEDRVVLQNINIHDGELVTTDGTMLGYYKMHTWKTDPDTKIPSEELKQKIILNQMGAKILTRILNPDETSVHVSVDYGYDKKPNGEHINYTANHMFFHIESYPACRLFSRAIAGRFPGYDIFKNIAGTWKTVKFNRTEMQNALKHLLSIETRDKKQAGYGYGKIIVRRESITAEYEGDRSTARFSVKCQLESRPGIEDTADEIMCILPKFETAVKAQVEKEIYTNIGTGENMRGPQYVYGTHIGDYFTVFMPYKIKKQEEANKDE